MSEVINKDNTIMHGNMFKDVDLDFDKPASYVNCIFTRCKISNYDHDKASQCFFNNCEFEPGNQSVIPSG